MAGYGSSQFLANDDIAAFLKQDLDLARSKNIYGHLWLAGRPAAAHPLHRYLSNRTLSDSGHTTNRPAPLHTIVISHSFASQAASRVDSIPRLLGRPSLQRRRTA
jgi:hypothetical protein